MDGIDGGAPIAEFAAPSSTVVGAVAAQAPDTAVAGHFGDPSGEQRTWDAGPAVVDRSHLDVVVVSGPERLGWLNALLSQRLDQLAADAPTEALLLSPNGHVEQHVEVVDHGERSVLVVEPGHAAVLTDFLDRMRFLTRVEVRDASEDLAVLTTRHVELDPETVPPGAVVIRRRWPEGAVDLLVPRREVAAAWSALLAAGTRPVGHDAFEAVRIAAGEARMGVDTDHRTLAHEVGWVGPAVHLDKGCYRGQETVARVHNLGSPPRRLVALHLDGSEHVLPARGVEIRQDGRAVGHLTSVAWHYELGPIGLAVVRKSVVDRGDLATVDGVAVAIDRDLSSATEPVDLSGIRG